MATRKKRKRMSKVQQQGEETRISHRVLCSLYPRCATAASETSEPSGLCTLYELILILLSPSFHHSQSGSSTPSSTTMQNAKQPCELASLLIQEGDSADYLALLQKCYAALPDATPPIGIVSLEQRWTQQQVVERVIQLQFRKAKNDSHVLCFGYQQPRPRPVTERRGTVGLDCVSENAAVEVLNSEAWRFLHSRVGDNFMIYLLSYVDIFHPLPQNCYLQVAGTAIVLSTKGHNAWSKFSKRRNRVSMMKNSVFRQYETLNMQREPMPCEAAESSWTSYRDLQKVSKNRESANGPSQGSDVICNADIVGTKIGRRLINRRTMFCKADFSQHAGFPRHHMLQRLRSTDSNAAMLFEAIFGQQNLSNQKLGGFGFLPCIVK